MVGKSVINIRMDPATKQQHGVKARKTLRDICNIDKENLTNVGAYGAKEASLTTAKGAGSAQQKLAAGKAVKKVTVNQISAADLTAEVPSEGYYKTLADARFAALQEALKENEELHRLNDDLKAKLDAAKEVISITNHVLQNLQTVLHESSDGEDDSTDADAVADVELHLEPQA